MRIPGFTAEVSSHVIRRSYRVASGYDQRAPGGGGSAIIIPAQEWYDYACAVSCGAACLPAIAGGFGTWQSCINNCNSFCTGHPVAAGMTPNVVLKA